MKIRTSLQRVIQLLILGLVVVSTPARADIEEDPVLGLESVGEKRGFFLEYFNYEEYVYSKSKKTELGDNVEVDTAIRYQYDENTFGRLRFNTDPVDNRTSNKTASFEFLGGHRANNWYFQVDVEVRGDDGSTTGGTTKSGETSIGLDLDSELTQITYTLNNLDITFYPFNFDGEVGSEFKTYDVTRIYYIEGSPTSFPAGAPSAGESIAEKTIPGLEFGYSLSEELPMRFYAGIGAASFLYPASGNFELDEAGVTASRWERREDIGYKAGLDYRTEDLRVEVEYVGHTEADKTGSLLKEAGSVYAIGRVAGFLIEPEVAYSKAGKRPYRLNRDRDWFEETTPFEPLYQDYSTNGPGGNGARQNWVGEEDFAYSLRVGYEMDAVVPYLAYKYQGENFVFRDRESAHTLRTADLSESHGGLNRYGAGVFIYSGNFLVNPQFEFLQANNPVFFSAADVRNDRLAATFEKQDYLLYLTVSYNFGPSRVFRP